MSGREYGLLGDELAAQLAAFAPSYDGYCRYWPSRVTLVDGAERDFVVVAQADEYFTPWGKWPEDDPGKRSVVIEEVAAIRESSRRLPARLAEKLYARGESGMGYYVFTVILRDGRALPFVTGGVVDFPALPKDVEGTEVVDVLPGVGRDQFRGGGPYPDESTEDYSWCLFRRRS